MKKLIAMLLALVLVMGLVACGNDSDANNPTAGTAGTTEGTEGTTGAAEDTTAAAVEPNEATVVFANIWAGYPTENAFFAMGGDMNNMVDNAPGNYSVTDEGLASTFHIPEDQIVNIACVSSLMHGMMANNFTGAVYKLNEGADVAAFVEAMHASIGSTQWLCGMPEKLLIAVIDTEYVFVAFGLNDVLNPMETAMTAAYADAEIKYSEAIAG